MSRQVHKIESAIVAQAHEMGARTFISYYPPLHLSSPSIIASMDALKSGCEGYGIEYVSFAEYDPMGEGVALQMFVLEDIPKKIAQYGRDTAFFSYDCRVQSALIMACLDVGAIFPSPCCPSPYHGFPAALELEGFYFYNNTSYLDDGIKFDAGFEKPELIADSDFIQWTRNQINKKIVDADMGGRFSTWPFPSGVIDTFVAVDYAMRWMTGEINGTDNSNALQWLIEAYTGPGVDIELLVKDGITNNNYYYYLQPYLTFSDEDMFH